MALKIYKPFHLGESEVQSLAHVPQSSTDWVMNNMNEQHQKFFSDLPYVFFGSLDKNGRPWSSVISGEVGFVNILAADKIIVKTHLSEADPLVLNLLNGNQASEMKLFSAVGVMLHNRRRNKLAGHIQNIISFNHDMVSRCYDLELELSVTQSYGNCPKYITIRNIVFERRMSPSKIIRNAVELKEGDELLPDCIEHILSCDSLYISTKRFSTIKTIDRDMDTNHRGGPPGFVRVTEDRSSIVIPDYSGNRLFQTLGNIQIDGLAGVTFPNYENGDVLYLTGTAKNYFDEEAKAIFPPFTRITVIKITGYIFIKEELPLKSLSAPIFSPYNPPVRLLPFEGSKYAASQILNKGLISVRISQFEALSEDITKYTMELSEPVIYYPGQYVILDFSKVLKIPYRHMAEDNPQSINDDLIRSWTVTSFPIIDSSCCVMKSSEFTITIKRKEGGLMSNILYDLQSTPNQLRALENITLLGFAGEFTICKRSPKLEILYPKILFLAAGIGITPFLAIWEGLKRIPSTSRPTVDIVLMFVGRNNDMNVLSSIVSEKDQVSSARDLFQINLFETQMRDTSLLFDTGIDSHVFRRVAEGDIQQVKEIVDRHAFICGPLVFMEQMTRILQTIGLPPSSIHKESFNF